MATFKLYRFADGKVADLDVEVASFGRRSPRRVQREAVLMYQANLRTGTHDTKTRAEVNDSKRKPWAQKHTGRARAGFKGSPLWKGGGIVHGPHPRDYSYHLPRKALRAAARAALAGKLRDGEVVFVDALRLEAPKTRKVAAMLDTLGVRRPVLFVLAERDENAWKSARNVEGVSMTTAAEVNAYELLRHRTILVTPEALESLRARLGAGGSPPPEGAPAPAAPAPAGEAANA